MELGAEIISLNYMERDHADQVHFGLIAAFSLIAAAVTMIATLNFSDGTAARPCGFAHVTVSRIEAASSLCFGYPGRETNGRGLAGSLN
jgi:hypothetical protein